MKTTALGKFRCGRDLEALSMSDAEELLGLTSEKVLERLGTSISGLSPQEVKKRIGTYGYNELAKRKRRSGAVQLALRFRSPLLLILLFASIVSIYLQEIVNAAIILGIVLASAVLDSHQESKAVKAAEALREKVITTATVLREGIKQEVKLSDLVPGDILLLSAGDLVPADARLIAQKDLFVDQSALTGESFPVEKTDHPVKVKGKTISEWTNFVFMGTSVTAGTATAGVSRTGTSTEYGNISKQLVARAPETEFEKGLRRFGYLMMEVTFLLVIFVFFMNSFLGRSILDSLLFSVALAVGLTPELLPMIVSINLSKGALSMSHKGVIVKRLASIQNLGSMDVLCTDKTGTLTENHISLVLHTDIEGKNDDKVLLYAYLNSYFQTGLKNPLDDAMLEHGKEVNVGGYKKIDEVPFDFTRRRASVTVEHAGEQLMVTKGAPEEILKTCAKVEIRGSVSDLTSGFNNEIEEQFKELSSQGYRVLGVSYKMLPSSKKTCTIGDECAMIFVGFVGFLDPPKQSAKKALQQLSRVGIEVKILTGDDALVTRKVCEELGFKIRGIVTGSELYEMNDDALARVVDKTNIFARVTPAQKNRIMYSLKTHGHVVGFLGDGINDAPSLKTADVGLSVNNAVDVAKESADIILLHKSLMVLHDGVIEGRKTFGNTMKYIRMGTSSNFGNMFSVAGASLFLRDFLPMQPTQILLNNLLYDVSETTIPTDNVDKEYIESPKRLDVAGVRKFMLFLGPISSIFDFLTFFIMLFIFHAGQSLFQTAWFLESLSTQTLVIFVIRTRKSPFFRSRPSKSLLVGSVGIVVLAFALPLIPDVGKLFGFMEPPGEFFVFLAGMIIAYLTLVELVKRWFYRRYAYRMEQKSVSKTLHEAYS
jgi:Mg2+-importing ATPase